MNTAADATPDVQRVQALHAAQQTAWDIVIIGGGITGAGILLEASRRGLKALLVEQRDFAWGTSSRSSKLVHGGLRYLKEGQLRLTRDSVRERQNLLQQAGGLVDPQSFAFADYRGRKPGRWVFQLGLAIYDRLAGRHQQASGHHYQRADDFLMLAPHIGRDGLKGGLTYLDAKTDDARLVLRVLQEARGLGAVAINYVRAEQLLRAGNAAEGVVTGVRLADALTADSYGVTAKVVINATGAWADGLRQQQGATPRLRPLRGSHLVLPAWRLPVAQAVSLMHPQDGRPVFVFPWEGATLVGTTDIDHRADLQREARITPAEVDYLMAALHYQFPSLQLTRGDVIATYAGVRPVIDTGKADPSQEGRDHAVWLENGLLTVTGGKLTTFRLIALDALAQVAHLLPQANQPMHGPELLATGELLAANSGLTTSQRQRLQGHYGPLAASVLAVAQPGELQTIPGTQTLWVELRWAARAEAVVHLQDLLLRRTRLGLLLRGGGADWLPRIRTICQVELGWNDARWQQEEADYQALWQAHYSLPQASEASEQIDTGERT
ncbi:MAG: glycerol-3-phosphate dehydrogenase/oxidase [Burkholderiales bacterium]|nr:glycerol-3-phosphate dehydrogenase/oxidase [Burkholderiales bacterium]